MELGLNLEFRLNPTTSKMGRTTNSCVYVDRSIIEILQPGIPF